MRTKLYFLAMGCLLMAMPQAASASLSEDLLNLSFAVKGDVSSQLASQCGLVEVDAFDSALPKPRVPAHTAFADLDRGVVAAYFFRNHVDQPRTEKMQLIYKRTNGGYLATIDLASEALSFMLTRGGVQARVWVTYTPRERRVHYVCGRRELSQSDFNDCLSRLFVSPLVETICRMR